MAKNDIEYAVSNVNILGKLIKGEKYKVVKTPLTEFICVINSSGSPDFFKKEYFESE